MRIAILGTRGIPNHYGGFEQCAEYLALGLVRRGFEVLVYNSHNHPFQENTWNGVNLIHCYDPEYELGTIGQFIYDFNCIWSIRKQKLDVILQLGYTSSSLWGWLLPKNVVVTTNMDGLEWKRTKYSKPVRSFLQFAEMLGIRYSDYLISDSIGIQDYLKEKYDVASTFIPYGADVFHHAFPGVVAEFKLPLYKYDLLIARLEPENSIETILEGVVKANTNRIFLVVGKHDTKYGECLKDKFKEYPLIRFVGGIYNMDKLNNLRYYSNLYFHGHTVGGTNPSLLEAMASHCLICANDNPFNRYILEGDALYFNNSCDVARVLCDATKLDERFRMAIKNNTQKIKGIYAWHKIVEQYANHLQLVKGKIRR